MRARFSFSTVLCLPLLACGGGGGGGAVDSSIHPIDSPHGTVDSPGGSGACSVASSYSAPSFGSAQVAQDQAAGSDFPASVSWQGAVTTSPAVAAEIDVFYGGGSGSGGTATPDWPTTLGPKSNVDVNAADVFVLLLGNLTGSGSAAQFQDLYLADMGTLTLTSAGTTGTFAGTGTGLSFTHVNGSDFSPAADGCTSTVATLAFSATIGSAAFAPSNGYERIGEPAITRLTHRTK